MHGVLAQDANNPANPSIKTHIAKLSESIDEHGRDTARQVRELKEPSKFMEPEQLQYHMEHFEE